MSIRRVKIENFRTIKDAEFYPSALCALVGENNSGKSNILSALKLVLGRAWLNADAFAQRDFWMHDASKDIIIELEFDPPLTYRKFAASSEIGIPVLRWTLTHYKQATTEAQAGDPRLVQECLQSDGTQIPVLAKAPRKGEQHKYTPLLGIPREVKAQASVIFVGTNRSLTSQAPGAKYSLLGRLLEDVDAALSTSQVTIPTKNGSRELSAREVFMKYLERAMQVLRIPEFKRLETVLRERSLENLGYDPTIDADRFRFHFGLLDSLEFLKAIKLMFREHDCEFDAAELGEGAQNALVVAIFQAYEELKLRGAVFLVEEPEMFLHPHHRRFFYRALRKLSKDNQIIYATHSPEFVAIPEYEDVRIVSRDSDGGTRVCSSTSASSPELREKLHKELDPERNELFFARHVVLVEGDTEKLALPEYAAGLKIDLDRVGCSVVEVGGKRSLSTFARIVSSFGIPAAVVFDTDSTDFWKDQQEAQKRCNEELRALRSDLVRVFEFDPKYESVLRKEMGESEYQRLCQAYPGLSKAIRHRLIAADASAPVPKTIRDILEPLAD